MLHIAREASASVLIMLTALVSVREILGPVLCRQSFVGRIRETLENANPEMIEEAFGALGIKYSGCAGALEEAKSVLAIHCRACGRCELARMAA